MFVLLCQQITGARFWNIYIELLICEGGLGSSAKRKIEKRCTMAHFTAFQEPYEHKTLLILPNVKDNLSNHGVCFLRKIHKIKLRDRIFKNMAWTWLSLWSSYRTSPRSGMFETMLLQQNTIAKWSNQKFDLELQIKMKTMSLKHAPWRYLKRFGTAKKKWKQCL